MSKGRLIRRLEDEIKEYEKIIRKTPEMEDMFRQEIEIREAEIRLIEHKRYDQIKEYHE